MIIFYPNWELVKFVEIVNKTVLGGTKNNRKDLVSLGVLMLIFSITRQNLALFLDPFGTIFGLFWMTLLNFWTTLSELLSSYQSKVPCLCATHLSFSLLFLSFAP